MSHLRSELSDASIADSELLAATHLAEDQEQDLGDEAFIAEHTLVQALLQDQQQETIHNVLPSDEHGFALEHTEAERQRSIRDQRADRIQDQDLDPAQFGAASASSTDQRAGAAAAMPPPRAT